MAKQDLSRRGVLALASALPLAGMAQGAAAAGGAVDIVRAPDSVTAYLADGTQSLQPQGVRWSGAGIEVSCQPGDSRLAITLEAPRAALLRVRLRWLARVPGQWRILNDQWERSYGDLEWRGMAGERVLPWYFLAFDGQVTHGYGVLTGSPALCFWQVDAAGISLMLDVRNGGGPVLLGPRQLSLTVVERQGRRGESPFLAASQFCRMMCPRPQMAAEPVYGGNNWYYSYGKDCSAADLRRDAELVAELAPAGPNRPFMVIDDGWSLTNTAGPWERGNDRFPDVARLAADMRKLSVRPGIWLRPLYTTAATPQSAQLRPGGAAGRATLDPSIPEVLEQVRGDIRRMVDWGYELVKHDFTSYDLLGRWGFAMGAELTGPGWHFSDRSRTTAEVVLDLYRAIAGAAADRALLIGCNTFGHLAAGLEQLQRTGDDTSGHEFHRTRRMGVNTLAFRAPQHRTFFDLDADCAPITANVDPQLSERWLDLVARSGTALFVSADPKVLDAAKKAAVRRAFAAAAVRRPMAEPLDWMQTNTPGRWRIDGQTVEYDWFGAEGGTPFPR